MSNTHLPAAMRSLACLCPNSTGYPSMYTYSSFQTYFFLSYSANRDRMVCNDAESMCSDPRPVVQSPNPRASYC